MPAPHTKNSYLELQDVGRMSMPNRRPMVLVAVKELGPPHSPWMWNQLCHMQSLELQLMYWMPPMVADIPAIGVPVHALDADPAPYHGKWRWAFRLANVRGRNFYAARGREYREIKALMQSLNPSSLLCYYGEVALRTIDVAHELGVPTIAYFHGGSDLQRNRWYRWSLKRRLHRFAAIVVVNEEERAWILAEGYPRNRSTSSRAGQPRTCSCRAARRRIAAYGSSWHQGLSIRRAARNRSRRSRGDDKSRGHTGHLR